VTGTGSNVAANPTHSISADKTEIEVTAFNTNYLLALEFIYINLSTVVIPDKT